MGEGQHSWFAGMETGRVTVPHIHITINTSSENSFKVHHTVFFLHCHSSQISSGLLFSTKSSLIPCSVLPKVLTSFQLSLIRFQGGCLQVLSLARPSWGKGNIHLKVLLCSC